MNFETFIYNIKTYDDFDNKLSHYIKNGKLTNKQAGDFFEILSLNIIKDHYLYKNQFKNIYLFKNIPKNIMDLLKLPYVDKGIDIYANDYNNNHYGIQCKYRSDRDKIITWNELSSFPGLNFTCEFHYGIFITNTYFICDILNKSNKIINITGNILDTLDETFFSKLKFKDNVNIIKKILKPFDYQQEIIKNTINHFENENNGQIIMACGTGKTLTSLFIIKEMKCKNIIVIVPSLLLLSQFLSEWNDNYNFKFATVCSDIDSKINGIILIRDEKSLESWIEYYDNETKVIFSTYQSGKIIKSVINKLNYNFDICIFDEAHRTTGKKGMFNILLNKLNVKKKLFLTATQKIYNGLNENICSMDNENIYGKKIYELNIYDAINRNLLTDFQIIIPIVYDNQIKELIKLNNIILNNDDNYDINYTIGALLLIKSINEYKSIKKIITYHNTIKECEEFLKILNNIKNKYNQNDLVCQVLTGKNSMREKNKIIDEFITNEKSVLCTAKALTEGINIKCVDSICFISKKNSPTDIIQCIGRSLRKYDGKNIANIIIPEIILSGERINNKILTIINSLKSMSNNNEIFIFEDNKKSKIKWNLIKTETIDKNIEIDFDLFCESINTKIYNKNDKKICNNKNDGTFQCEKCFEKYINENDLINHILTKKICGKYNLKYLFKIKNNKITNDIQNNIQNNIQNDKQYYIIDNAQNNIQNNIHDNKQDNIKLNIRDKIQNNMEYNTQNNLSENKKSNKNIDENILKHKNGRIRGVYCPRCGEKFHFKQYLNSHLEKKNICPVLYYNIDRETIIKKYYDYDITEMINILKNKIKNDKHSCIYCGKEYDKVGSLYVHISRSCKLKREIINTLPIKKYKNDDDSDDDIKKTSEDIKDLKNKINFLEKELDILKKNNFIL